MKLETREQTRKKMTREELLAYIGKLERETDDQAEQLAAQSSLIQKLVGKRARMNDKAKR